MNNKIFQATILLWLCVPIYAQNSKKINLEDIWQKYVFYPESPDEIKSMNNGTYYTLLENQTVINKYEYKSGKKVSTLLNINTLNTASGVKNVKSVEDYEFSANEEKILFASESKSIYRRSKEAWFWIYDIKRNTIESLFSDGKQRLAKFSPDGKKVAFVYQNNLYIKNIETKDIIQITKDGKDRSIINGTTDWVYEEELEITNGFSWSDDGTKIAYLRFDESDVKEYSMTKWGKLYPEEHKYKYPKAGEKNSIVDLYIYDLSSKSNIKIETGSETDQYIPRFQWVPNKNEIMYMRLNRLQNKYTLNVYEYTSKQNNQIFSDSSKYWVEVPGNITFLNQSKLITTSERDGYNHIYQVTFKDSQNNYIKPIVDQITQGKWIVREIKGIEQKNGTIYYTSTESSSTNSDLSVVDLKTKKTSTLSTKLGTWDAEFNSDFTYYMGSFSDANTAPNYSIFNQKGKHIRTLISNDRVNMLTKEYNFQPKTISTITISNGIELNTWMIKPENFDSTKKYPVLMYVYGGPGSQSVENQWGYFDLAWYEMLSQLGYIVICVDNRGTGGKGEEFEKCTYMQLGKFETEDQIESAKYFARLPYIDANRIGIWGWSYGGYMTSLCITKGAETFKTAIAVAPVTNWRFYDNIYTERFMRTPQENGEGYDYNSPINFVKQLKGNYFIIHGSADDNVHYQNSMEITNQLIKENKQFRQFTYPNRNHNISGGYTRSHLYQMLTDYILKNL